VEKMDKDIQNIQQQQKPNILFILIDDMGWRDIGCNGSTFYETPNIDSIAEEGMRFTDAYAACPVCSPTRASILSGKYPANVGMTNFIGGNNEGKLLSTPYLHYLPLEEKTIAKSLKENGYNTFHVGKWHLGDESYWPEHHGFDVNVAGCGWGSPNHGYFSPYDNPRLENGPEGEYLTDRLTQEAVKLIKENSKQKENPFFMYMSYYSVHIPIQAPLENIKKYEEKAKKLGLDKEKTFELGDFIPTVRKKDMRIKRRLIQSDPKYAAMVERLDINIGKLLTALEETGLKDDTIVIFFSDNGGLSTAESSPTCNSPLAEGKGWMYEGGTREPLLIRWPKVVQAGSTCETPVISTDFYPTFLEAAKLPLMPEQHQDGVSLMSLLTNSNQIFEREAIYWHYPHYGNQGGTPGSSIRAGDYKLIEFFEDGHLELYNLKDDIEETTNLVTHEPILTKALYTKLKQWQKKVEAKIPKPNPGYPYCFSPVYEHVTDEFFLNDEGVLCSMIQFAPENPTKYEVSITEILEDYLNKTVELKINDVNLIGSLSIDENEKLMFEDSLSEKIQSIQSMLPLEIDAKKFQLTIKACKAVDESRKFLIPEKLLVSFELTIPN
jgi:arylsulfatase A-like enzyme